MWASNAEGDDELHAYLDVMIADRCRHAGHDLLSTLIQLQVDGQDLTVNDLQVIVTSLVAPRDLETATPLPVVEQLASGEHAPLPVN